MFRHETSHVSSDPDPDSSPDERRRLDLCEQREPRRRARRGDAFLLGVICLSGAYVVDAHHGVVTCWLESAG